jgi:hypothetical protein
MKVWACLELRETGPLGLPSRAAEKLGGRTVLEHTAARAAGTEGLEGVAVLVEPGRGGSARALLGALAGSVRVLEVLGPDAPAREALRRSRKWSKDGWRLGIGQSMDLDAAGHFPSLAAAARELGADALVSVLPEAVLVDPQFLRGLIDHGAPEDQPPLPFAFCQLSAGFAGLFAMRGWLEPMAAQNRTCGSLFAWSRETSTANPIARHENMLTPLAVRRGEFRGTLDSRRGRELVDEILRRSPGADGLGPGAAEAVALVVDDPALYAGRLPRVVEVEITTAGRVPFADTPFALPAPERVMKRELFEKLLGDLAAYDDVLLTLGGWGDPLAHPEVFDFLALARQQGVYGLHLDTPGTLLDEQRARRLVESDLDVVSVRLGAGGAATYRQLTGREDFDAVTAAVARLIELRGEAGRAWPFVCVEAEKRVEAEGELVDFFDRWSREADWAVIRPFSDYCSQLPDRATLHLNLAERGSCRRLLKEMLVLADGTVPVCRMDFRAGEPAGSIAESSVEELWTTGRLAELRAGQHAGKFDGFRLCPACRDWDGI